MSEFDERLRRAIERGGHRSEARRRADQQRALSEEECRRRHTQYRLELSEQIERCLKKLPAHFPGFQYETIFGERGWGGACRRDDFALGADGKRANQYSRLEMTIRPYSAVHVLELVAKGTIQNKEVFNRTHYEKLIDAEPAHFADLIDLWTLEYAELFAAAQ